MPECQPSDSILAARPQSLAYWQAGLAATPPIHFELDGILIGADSIAILYRNQIGRRVIEVLVIGAGHRIIRGMAHYG